MRNFNENSIIYYLETFMEKQKKIYVTKLIKHANSDETRTMYNQQNRFFHILTIW